MSDSQAQAHVEALLFALGRPLSRSELCKLLDLPADAVERAIQALAEKREGNGVVLVDDGQTVELRTSPEAAKLVERIRKEEYSRDIGKAGLEALAAILYRGPLSRSEVDFIRGVNSSQTLRTLLMRGLIRRVPSKKDERSFLYEPTTELLSQLGVSRAGDLPEYGAVRQKLTTLEAEYRESQHDA